jgi:hypothetical protein
MLTYPNGAQVRVSKKAGQAIMAETYEMLAAETERMFAWGDGKAAAVQERCYEERDRLVAKHQKEIEALKNAEAIKAAEVVADKQLDAAIGLDGSPFTAEPLAVDPIYLDCVTKAFKDSKRKYQNQRDYAADFLNVSVDKLDLESAQQFILSGGSTLHDVLNQRRKDLDAMTAMLALMKPATPEQTN